MSVYNDNHWSRERATERLPEHPGKHSVAMANLTDSRRGIASDSGGNALLEAYNDG